MLHRFYCTSVLEPAHEILVLIALSSNKQEPETPCIKGPFGEVYRKKLLIGLHNAWLTSYHGDV